MSIRGTRGSTQRMEIIEILSILEKSGHFRDSAKRGGAVGYGKTCPMEALKKRPKAATLPPSCRQFPCVGQLCHQPLASRSAPRYTILHTSPPSSSGDTTHEPPRVPA